MAETRRREACLRLDAPLAHDHQTCELDPAARQRLRELAGLLLCVHGAGRALVQVTDELVNVLVGDGRVDCSRLWNRVPLCEVLGGVILTLFEDSVREGRIGRRAVRCAPAFDRPEGGRLA